MKTIIIYGPPGVGKMTVAKELVKITKGKYLPHNLIFDLISPIISEDTADDDLWDLYEEIKVDILKTAKKKDVDVVITDIYNNPISNERFEEFIDELRKAKIPYKFVKLTCDKSAHLKRVSNEERKNTKKVSSIKLINKIMKKSDLDSEIPFVKNLVIDNTNLSAKQVAMKIKKELK